MSDPPFPINLDPTLGVSSIPVAYAPSPFGDPLQSPEIYCEPERGHLTNVHAPALLHFTPQHAQGGAVIVCPGGSYHILSMTKEGRAVALWLNHLGFHVFVLKYRLSGYRFPTQLQDVCSALRLVRSHAAAWGISPRHIGAMGFSAGGHLVSMLATLHRRGETKIGNPIDQIDARPDWVALIYPVISTDPAVTHRESVNVLLGPHPAESQLGLISTDLQVNSQIPPALLVHAWDDQDVPLENSQRFHEAIKAHNADSTLHVLASGGHGFGLGGPPTRAPDWTPLCQQWMMSRGIIPAA